VARQDAGELGDGVELPLRIVQRVEDEHLGAGVEDALELLAAVLQRPADRHKFRYEVEMR